MPQKLRNDVDVSGTGTHAQRNWIDVKMTARIAKIISTPPPPPDEQKRNLTHLLEQSLGAETRQLTRGTLRMRRPHAQTYIAIETVRDQPQKPQIDIVLDEREEVAEERSQCMRLRYPPL